MFRCVAKRLILLLVLMLLGAPAAGAAVEPYGTNDYGGFRDILPPGTNGFDNASQLGAYETSGTRPAHSSDQLGMYSALTTAAGSITASTIPDYYKDSTFGVPTGDVESSQSPEPGVTIVRDKQFGVPHIYGDTRAALMYGIGYATAEDRLFFIDVLRHSGNGDLASFAGGANVGMDESVWSSEPYTQQDRINQVNHVRALPDGAQIYSDASNYIAGINGYIQTAEQPLNRFSMLPSEYAAIGQPGGPQPFSLTDLVSIATLVGGIFGKGGGEQLANAQLYQNLLRRFGPEHYVVAGYPQVIGHKRKAKPKRRRPRRHRHHRRADHSGFASLLSFVASNDPEAPTTVHGRQFRYQTLPRPSRAVARTIALPDYGSVQPVNPVAGAGSGSGSGTPPIGLPGGVTVPGVTVPGGTPVPVPTVPVPTVPGGVSAPHSARATGPSSVAGALQGLLAFPRGMSNALLVSARNSASGHPLAVMGPQVAYFAPQILMEEDIHGPGIDAAGAAFPGVNLYVELGHGPDYAWSATSSGQNIVDTFAVPLCNPNGGAPAMSSEDYLLHGQCVPMETLNDQESWTPNLADQTPAGSITLRTERTAYGLVIARARIHGRPVVYTDLRSTYMHELDSVVGFERFNEPAAIRSPQDFFNAANHIGYTFNWFYADNKHIGYFNSGLNPVRAPHTDPLFPSWASDAWVGLHPGVQTTPSNLVERDTPQSAHPQVIDQSYLTSWNNKQAPGYGDAATGEEFSSIYRSQLLDNNLKYYLRRDHGKLNLADLINAMGVAGTQDLRGVEVLPSALRIIGHPTNPTLAGAVAALRAWVASGSHRINRSSPGTTGNYDQSGAVRIMDAWWPLLVKAEFGPLLGSSLLGQVETEFPINDEPGHGTSGDHLGSAFDVGFYGIVQKDLRSALHRKVRGALNRVYCGSGSLARCRAALDASLSAAVAESPQQVYPADSVCSAGDQMCSDSIQFRPIGAVKQPLIEWVNRPTFQQADEIQGHRP